ncbi:CBS domain-containing protein [Sphingomonas abaci]|uniref:CBS domain-containing protein n=1 Tax=Sphingomonas abaci TaxID=237611 RepID=A0A7W7AIE2_9SPHN|nr:CBS domain-containing protein [Sphingomonas abaci]MBB4617605.1 CBS domain-containing protein [Sphingomonas abaci]
MTIAAILGKDPVPVVTIRRDATVARAVDLLVQHRIGAVPVMDGDTVAGILSERDVVRLLARDREALDEPVDSVMTAPAITVGRAEPVIGALSLMTRRRIRHLPVVEDGRLVGLVSIGDLVKYRIDRIEAEAAAMRDYIQSA